MTDRQRAFVSAMVYVAKNARFASYHSIGVKRMPDGLKMYEFRGEWRQDSISVQDDKYNRAYDRQYYSNPWGIEVNWIGQRSSDYLRIRVPLDGSRFYGLDGDYFKFEGSYYAPSTQVEIRDTSQDRYQYAYRISW